MTRDEQKLLGTMSQEARNTWVQTYAERTDGAFVTQAKRGTDGQSYLAFCASDFPL